VSSPVAGGLLARARALLGVVLPLLADDPLPPAAGTTRRGRQLVVHGVALALALAAATAFWGTAATTSWARISVLRTVEPYALAVHEQLVRNKAEDGRFHQTIHRGYDDAWTWSGHRAITLVTTSWLYPFHPSAHWLSRIMILAVLAGAIPAGLLGRRALGSGWGFALGALLYLGTPTAMALALQDYQDLVFALPCLTFALWAFGARHWAWAPVGAFVGLMPREECVPLVVIAAAVVIPAAAAGPRWRRWLINVGAAAAVAAAYTAYIVVRHPVGFQGEVGGGHDMPAVNATLTAVQALFTGELPGLESGGGFYALMFAPLGLLAMFAPLTALPGLALIFFHLTVPEGHGVDRLWGGHSHHMAPALAFVVVASVQGAGRLLRLASRGGWRERWAGRAGWRRPAARVGPALAACAAVIALGYGLWWYAGWARWFNLETALWPRRPQHEHPAWELSRMLPADAVPVVFLDASICVSNRARAYTYEESLLDKEPLRGLGAATHMIVDKNNKSAMAWAYSMPGLEVIADQEGYALLTWTPGAADPTVPRAPELGGPGPRGQPINEGAASRWIPDGVSLLPGCPPRGR